MTSLEDQCQRSDFSEHVGPKPCCSGDGYGTRFQDSIRSTNTVLSDVQCMAHERGWETRSADASSGEAVGQYAEGSPKAKGTMWRRIPIDEKDNQVRPATIVHEQWIQSSG